MNRSWFTDILIRLSVGGDMSIPGTSLILGTRSVHGWPAGNALDCEEAISFAQLQGLDCRVETFPLSEAPKAFEAMTSGRVRGRAVIVME